MEFGKASGIQSDPTNSITRGFELGTAQGAPGFAAHSAGQGLINAGAAASIGSAATVQAPFWGGAQASKKAAQVAGANGLIRIQIASVDFSEGSFVPGVPPSSCAGLFGFFFNQAIEG